MKTTKSSGFNTGGTVARIIFAVLGALIFWYAYSTHAPYEATVWTHLAYATGAYAGGFVVLQIFRFVLAMRAKRWLSQLASQIDLSSVLDADTPTAAVGRLGYVLRKLELPSAEFVKAVTRSALLAFVVSFFATGLMVVFLIKAALVVDILWLLGGLCLLQALCKLVSILSVTTVTTEQGLQEQTQSVERKKGVIFGFSPPGLVYLTLDLSSTRRSESTMRYI